MRGSRSGTGRLPALARAVARLAAALLRGSAATQVYTASQGDLIAAQALLNHARIDTTERYIRGPEAARLQADTIARAQALMIGWVMGDSAKDAPAPEPLPASMPFGHDCLNLLAGDRPGKPCSKLGACLRCPGLVIPLDEHLARILAAIDALEAARERLDPARWQMIYGPSHRILVSDILPDFPGDLRGSAPDHRRAADAAGARMTAAVAHAAFAPRRRDIVAFAVQRHYLASGWDQAGQQPQRLLARLGLHDRHRSVHRRRVHALARCREDSAVECEGRSARRAGAVA
jgi:hypothetical protein